MRPGYERILSYEAHLDLNHWNNLDATYKRWSEYNGHSDGIRERQKAAEKLVQLIETEVLPKLTKRQRQITQLYFKSQLTEEEIARKLGISQPTVSQHLFGKKRNGKKVGGSVHKMQKIILKKTSSRSALMTQAEYMTALREFFKNRPNLLSEIAPCEDFEA